MGKEKIASVLFACSAAVLLLGAILYNFTPVVAPFVFSVGVLGIIVARVLTAYSGNDFRMKRLYWILYVGTMMYIVTAYFMFMHNQNWVIALLISAVIELIVSLRIPKQAKHSKQSK